MLIIDYKIDRKKKEVVLIDFMDNCVQKISQKIALPKDKIRKITKNK